MSTPALDRSIIRDEGLYGFVRLAWPHVESSEFVPNWHLECIAAHLMAAYRGECPDLIINMPPGCAKSLLTGVFWCAMVWTIDPSFRWIYGSFDQTLVGKRDGQKVLTLCRSAWYKRTFGDVLKPGPQSTSDIQTAAGGFRYATSPGAGGTGRHANAVVVDDPIKPAKTVGAAAVTKNAIESVSSWRSGTLSTRKANPKKHINLLVMQRLSFEDPTAENLTVPGVVHLRLPMRYEVAAPCETPFGRDPRTVEGELLFPGRFDEMSVATLERELNIHAAAQLQQRPTQAGGGIFRREAWRYWSRLGAAKNEPCVCELCYVAGRCLPGHDSGRPCAALPTHGFDWQSWDMSFKGEADSDFTAGGAWREGGGRIFLRDACNARLSFGKARAQILVYKSAYPCPDGHIIVEDAANGPAVIDDLGLTAVPTGGGHVARAHVASPYVATGLVYLPHPDENPITWAILKQASAFPNSVNDDLVDMVTHAIVWHRQRSGAAYLDQLAALKRAMQ